MAKYRHRVFEMYEFREEATEALTPKSARPITEGSAPESWTFKHLAVSRPASVTHVRFKAKEILGEETISELREELAELSDRLVLDSKVLFDFTSVTLFSAAAIDELILFNQKVRTKGSRIALCCLDPSVHQSFFGKSNRHDKRE